MAHPINDLMIRIKNGYGANNESVETPHSVFREEVLKKLKKLGYIEDFGVTGDIVKTITIQLKYVEGAPAMTDVKLFSTSGRRMYSTIKSLKPVLGGMGYSILSTPQGILTHVEAKKMKHGGELLFNIW